MLLFTGNIQKAYKARNLFRLDDQRRSRYFFQTCLIRIPK